MLRNTTGQNMITVHSRGVAGLWPPWVLVETNDRAKKEHGKQVSAPASEVDAVKELVSPIDSVIELDGCAKPTLLEAIRKANLLTINFDERRSGWKPRIADKFV